MACHTLNICIYTKITLKISLIRANTAFSLNYAMTIHIVLSEHSHSIVSAFSDYCQTIIRY